MAKQKGRLEQSRRELERSLDAFESWLARRRKLDAHAQYKTQLTAIKQVIGRSFGLMREQLDGISDTAGMAETYEVCLRVDRQLVWVRRFWDYFRGMWDQRDDSETGRVLAAADEIVWSCFVQPLQGKGQDPRPAPLPFIAAEFSPQAIPRSQPPQSLRPSDELLWKVLDELPVPVVGLPRLCIDSPWWMVLIAHELGHQVARELGDAQFRAVVATAAAEAAASAGVVADEKWSVWAHELFADAFAGAQIGAAHLGALAELELGTGSALLRPAPGYPPGIVRQALAAELLRCLGLEDSEMTPCPPALPDLDGSIGEVEDRERAKALLAIAPAIARALACEPLVADRDLRSLAGFARGQLSRCGAVGQWQRQFAGAAEVRPKETSEAARLATAGAFSEWAEAMSEPDQDKRRERMDRLRARMLEVVPNCRMPGTRAAATPGPEIADLADRIAREVNALPPEMQEARAPGADAWMA